MSLGSVLVVVIVAVLAWVIYTSHQRMDPVDEACAVEIAALIQSGKSVEADDVLALLRKHQRTYTQATSVAAIVAPKLRNSGAHQDERQMGMIKVREAVNRLKKEGAPE